MKATSEERQEVEAGSRSSKMKRQQMNHLPFPGESLSAPLGRALLPGGFMSRASRTEEH